MSISKSQITVSPLLHPKQNKSTFFILTTGSSELKWWWETMTVLKLKLKLCSAEDGGLRGYVAAVDATSRLLVFIRGLTEKAKFWLLLGHLPSLCFRVWGRGPCCWWRETRPRCWEPRRPDSSAGQSTTARQQTNTPSKAQSSPWSVSVFQGKGLGGVRAGQRPELPSDGRPLNHPPAVSHPQDASVVDDRMERNPCVWRCHSLDSLMIFLGLYVVITVASENIQTLNILLLRGLW